MAHSRVAREVRLRELLIGVEGLALLRNLYDGSTDEADQRIAEVRRVLDDDVFAAGELTTEGDVTTGYRLWSARYDEPGNLLIAMEQPAVWALLDNIRPGTSRPDLRPGIGSGMGPDIVPGIGSGIGPGEALDAACGTGRHAQRLLAHGYQVTGVDLTPEMLEVAKRNVPAAQFHTADLLALPFPARRFDLVVCGLAIAHIEDLRAGVAELARVLRPGGRLIISALHPFQAHLGWHAPFQDADGNRGFIREYPHTHSDYFTAFTAAGLTVRACVEPTLGIGEIPAKRRAFRHLPEATVAAYLDLPAVLVWDVEKTA